MMPNLDPKKMKAIMKQMGINQEEIEANQVIIEKDDGRIIIENPQIIRVNMQGQDSYQISGEVREESLEESSEEEKIEEDIKSIVDQTGVSKEIAAIELEKNNGDIAETIIALSKKK